MPMSKSSASRLKAAENRQAVLQLRRAGFTYARISEQVGLSAGRCVKIVNACLAEFATDAAEQVEELRRLQLCRIDHALAAISAKISTGHLGAIDRMVRLEERRSRLLGLDAPTRVAPTNPAGTLEYKGGGLASLLRLNEREAQP